MQAAVLLRPGVRPRPAKSQVPETFVAIVCSAIVVAVLAFTAWNAIVAAIVLAVVERDVSWTVALIGAAVLHLAAAGGVVFWMR